jgi:hypothetical protein
MAYWQSNNLNTYGEVEIFSLKNKLSAIHNKKYLNSFVLDNKGNLYGAIPDSRGLNEYVFIEKVDIRGFVFKYAKITFKRNDLYKHTTPPIQTQ